MLSLWVGETSFRKALKEYLETNKFRCGTPEKLWGAFDSTVDAAPSVKVAVMGSSWTDLAGYPVIFVEQSQVDPTEVTLIQKRFIKGKTAAEILGDLSTSDVRWVIPVRIRTDAIKSFDFVMESTKATLKIPELETGFAMLNADQAGFYRVYYDDALFGKLRSHFGKLSSVEKNGIIQDVREQFFREGS